MFLSAKIQAFLCTHWHLPISASFHIPCIRIFNLFPATSIIFCLKSGCRLFFQQIHQGPDPEPVHCGIFSGQLIFVSAVFYYGKRRVQVRQGDSLIFSATGHSPRTRAGLHRTARIFRAEISLQGRLMEIQDIFQGTAPISSLQAFCDVCMD